MKDLSKKIKKLKPGAPQLLVIEKDQSLTQRLEGLFPLVSAADETKAFDLLEKVAPRAILIEAEDDEANALRMCKQFKANVLTSEIPVILLRQQIQDEGFEIACLKAGAEEVFSRSASQDLLEAKIKGLIDREMFSVIHSTFLQEVDRLVQMRLKNPDFGVEKLAELLEMDRKTLYRKVKDCSGMTPQYYIRKSRLDRALQMLERGSFTVAEVAAEVGIKDVSYFSKSFKEHFGKLPSACKHCLVS